MSFLLCGQIYLLDLPHSRQAVLLALAEHARDDGSKVFPRVGHIAWKIGYSVRAVQTHLAELREAGIVEIVYPAFGPHPAEYRIDISRVPTKPPYRPSATGRPAKKGGANSAPPFEKGDEPHAPEGCSTFTGGVQQVHPRGERRAPLTSLTVKEKSFNHPGTGDFAPTREGEDLPGRPRLYFCPRCRRAIHAAGDGHRTYPERCSLWGLTVEEIGRRKGATL